MAEYMRGYREGLADGKAGQDALLWGCNELRLDDTFWNGYRDGYQTGRMIDANGS